MAVERAGEPGDRRRKREGLRLEAQHRLARDLRHLGVLADGAQRAAVGRAIDAAHQQEHRQQHDQQDREINRVEVAAQGCLPRPGNARDAVGAVRQPVLVGGDQAHHLGEAQGDDGEIVLAQPRGRKRHDQTGRAAGDQRQRPAGQDRRVARRGRQRRGIGADGEEAGEAEIDHARAAPDQVEAERQQGVDAADRGDEQEIARHR